MAQLGLLMKVRCAYICYICLQCIVDFSPVVIILQLMRPLTVSIAAELRLHFGNGMHLCMQMMSVYIIMIYMYFCF